MKQGYYITTKDELVIVDNKKTILSCLPYFYENKWLGAKTIVLGPLPFNPTAVYPDFIEGYYLGCVQKLNAFNPSGKEINFYVFKTREGIVAVRGVADLNMTLRGAPRGYMFRIEYKGQRDLGRFGSLAVYKVLIDKDEKLPSKFKWHRQTTEILKGAVYLGPL